MIGDDGLMDLRVTRAERAADGIRIFELQAPDGGSLPAFTPGAHLAVRVPSGAMRSYSLCNDPAERHRYVIAVKRETGGRGGSISLVDQAWVGDTILVGPPRNLFELDLTAQHYIFVAGGIGITPILAMIRHLMALGGKPFTLYYLTRAPEGTAFLDALQSFDGPDSRIVIHHDQGDPANAYDLWPVFENPSKAHVYCCGPRPLMEAVRDMTGHWPGHAVHFEDFGSDLAVPKPGDAPFTVRLAKSGASYEVPAGTSILAVLREHGMRTPSSCESGTCGTCRTRLIAGEVDHRDMVLDPEEEASNIMICVSRGRNGCTVEIDL